MRAALAAALVVLSAGPTLAIPTCPVNHGGFSLSFTLEIGKLGESERAALGEQRLRARGIDANNTRFWNGCLQTFVTENGHVRMRFYDPETLEEVPVD